MTTTISAIQADNPERILALSWGIAQTGTLTAALDLGLFTLIDEGFDRVPDLAARTGCSTEGVARLLNALGALGLVEPHDSADGPTYTLTADVAAFLVEGKPKYIGDLRHMHHALNYTVWPTLAETVKAGRPSADFFGSDGSQLWTKVTPYLDQLGAVASQWLTPTLVGELPDQARVLDLGCGSGGYSRMIGRTSPGTTVVGVDRPDVVDAFTTEAAAAGLSDRVLGVSGDIRQVIAAEPAESYDLVLLANLLHGYDLTACDVLMHQVARVLKPGGRVAIFEIVPNTLMPMENPVATFFGLQMLMTSGGHAYTGPEYQRLCESVGLVEIELSRCPSGPQTLITARSPRRVENASQGDPR